MPGTATLTDTQTDTQATGDRLSPDAQNDERPACQWVTIREAMQILGVSEATVHRRAKRIEGRKGKLYKERNDDGGVLVGIPVVTEEDDRHVTVGASHLTGDEHADDLHVTVDDAQVIDANTQATVTDAQGDSQGHALDTHLPVISMYWQREQQLLDRIAFLEQQATDFMSLQQQHAATIDKQNDAVLELQSELRALQSATTQPHQDAHTSVTIRGAKRRGWFARMFGSK